MIGPQLRVSEEADSEEKTEPFSSSEYASRIEGVKFPGMAGTSQGSSSVHLDELVVPSDRDIRLLVRPLRSRSVSPGYKENCEWVALRSEESALEQLEETVLAVTQTSKDIKFTVFMPGERHGDGTPLPQVWCELYYDPASDNQILLNNCYEPIVLSRISQPVSTASEDAAALVGTPSSPSSHSSAEFTVNPGSVRALFPGTWKIKCNDAEVLDFRILGKRQATIRPTAPPAGRLDEGPSSPTLNSSGKRQLPVDEDTAYPSPSRRRQKSLPADVPVRTEDDGDKEAVIMFLRPTAEPLVFPLPTAAAKLPASERRGGVGAGEGTSPTTSHELLALRKQETLEIPGHAGRDAYRLTKQDHIASTTLSTVFTGVVDHPDVPSESIITVKVIKTRLPSPAGTGTAVAAATRMQETGRNVIRQADAWEREYSSHKSLKHNSIVRLYGGDARYLSLYMEHIDGRDLSTKGIWRDAGSDYFMGRREDAARILRDMAGALNYVHRQNIVHNDIKPANILYTRDRRAVLCDFGLSTRTNNLLSTGGTPYYVPPEFIGGRQRGPESDVWALGVTMLYVLRKTPLPDARGRQRAKYWLIADVNKAPAFPHQMATPPGKAGADYPPVLSAASRMQMWLQEVKDIKDRLDASDLLERLTLKMLTPNPTHRITTAKLVEELRTS